MQTIFPPGSADLSLDELRSGADLAETWDRPWLMMNFVTSINGTITVDGRSGGLSGDADRHLFRQLRAATDVVLAGAGTARTEQYRRPSTPEQWRGWRAEHRLAPAPLLALVSRSGDIPDDLPLLQGDGEEPLLYHPDRPNRPALPRGIRSVACGDAESVDLRSVLEDLHGRGARSVLCEGGPHLFGDLSALDLVDELFVTLSPKLVGPESTRMLVTRTAFVQEYSLHRVLQAGDEVLLAYRRRRDAEVPG